MLNRICLQTVVSVFVLSSFVFSTALAESSNVTNADASSITQSSQNQSLQSQTQAVSPAQQSSSLTGAVQVTQTLIPANTPAVAASTAAATVAALQAKDYLDIEVVSQSSKHALQTYALSVQNKQSKHIELLQIEVLNGMTEQAFMQVQQESANSKKRVAGGILRGVTGIASSFIPYAGLGSFAAYQAVGAGTQAAYMAAGAIENTPNGSSANYAGHVVQRANNILVSPNQSFQCLAVVPEKQTPIVKVIFKDLQTNQIFETQK